MTHLGSIRLGACEGVCSRLLAGGTVDAFAEDVGVTVVPCILLDHVEVDPPQRVSRTRGDNPAVQPFVCGLLPPHTRHRTVHLRPLDALRQSRDPSRRARPSDSDEDPYPSRPVHG
jgi:hypothetical protein